MDKMLYVAMTGASQNARAQQAHANNLANISTTGFRRDFEQARSMQVFGDSHPARVYAMSERPGTDFTPGTLILMSPSKARDGLRCRRQMAVRPTSAPAA